MSNAPTKSPAPTAKQTAQPAPAQTNPVRMGILLGILALVVAILIHHYFIAQPATDKAFDEIQALFDKRNARGVVAEGSEGAKIDAKLLQPKDVQEHLKKKPWSTKVMPDYTVETYWWYGMPHKNYISILYYGSGDKLRFNTHYKNGPPLAEDLPGAVANEAPPAKGDGPGTAPPTTGETGTPSKGGPPMPPPGPGTQPEAPTEKPAEANPAEEKPAVEKPAEAKPAEEKPAAEEKKE